jgi:PTS system cellobiose-specific IIB component
MGVIQNILEEFIMNILLCCAAGMSTSLLVTKMEAAAKEQGLESKIWAVSADQVKANIDQADYLLPQMQQLGKEKNIPVDSINPIHYGMCNGAEVLKTAVALKN